MRTIALAFRYLWSRPLQALLNLLLLTLGLASITFVVLASAQVDRSFKRDLSAVDLVVGAKGSPMQLILAGLFHMDVPPGSVALKDVQAVKQLPQVRELIPLAVADTYRGWRIVGTTDDFFSHYRLAFTQGQAGRLPMDAVIGADVAQSAALTLGDRIIASHGLDRGGAEHRGTPYRIKGILAPCDCVADRLVLTPLESVWQLHEPRPVEPAEGATAEVREPAHEITMALVTYKSPQGAATVPAFVNRSTSMQAAAPAVELAHLSRLLGVGSEVMRGLGVVLLLTAALSVFIAMWNAVRERRDDLAMLRMLGATPLRVAMLLWAEALWLALLATLLGLATGHAITALVGYLLESQHSFAITGRLWVPVEGWIPVAAAGVATLAALVPSVSAYRLDVADLLHAR